MDKKILRYIAFSGFVMAVIGTSPGPAESAESCDQKCRKKELGCVNRGAGNQCNELYDACMRGCP